MGRADARRSRVAPQGVLIGSRTPWAPRRLDIRRVKNCAPKYNRSLHGGYRHRAGEFSAGGAGRSRRLGGYHGSDIGEAAIWPASSVGLKGTTCSGMGDWEKH